MCGAPSEHWFICGACDAVTLSRPVEVQGASKVVPRCAGAARVGCSLYRSETLEENDDGIHTRGVPAPGADAASGRPGPGRSHCRTGPPPRHRTLAGAAIVHSVADDHPGQPTFDLSDSLGLDAVRVIARLATYL